jgi:hypothetical protein
VPGLQSTPLGIRQPKRPGKDQKLRIRRENQEDFLRNKGEEHGLKAMIRECANLQYLCIFASVMCPILTTPQLPNGALPSPDTKYSFEKQVRESSSQMGKEWESVRLMVERYFQTLIAKEHLPAVELE